MKNETSTTIKKLAEVKKQMNQNHLTSIENEAHPSLHPSILLDYQSLVDAENDNRRLDKSAPWRYTGARRKHCPVKKLRYKTRAVSKTAK